MTNHTHAVLRCSLAAVLSLFSTLVFADGRLSGTVTQADPRRTGGLVVEGASVRIEELGRETVTGRDGRYSFIALPPGRYTLKIQYLGLAPLIESIEVDDTQTARKDIRLSADVAELDPLTVVGNASMLNEALARQRAADNIRSIVNADAIGDFPDTNAAEALQRLPGVSVERDQGEGRFVRIRGLGPGLNSVTVNGAKLPSPESGTRAVALDVIPTELLESLDVSKALTPDQDADSLGGSIDVRPLSAFDRAGLYYRLSATASRDQHTSQTSPKFAFAGSQIFALASGSEIGVAGGYSVEERDFGSDNAEAADNWQFDDSEALLGEFEQRDYSLTRKRTGLTLNLDYRTLEGQAWYLHYLDSGFEDTEQRLANVFAFLADDGTGELDGTEIAPGDRAEAAEIVREFKKRTETLDVRSLMAGGDNHIGAWGVGYQLAYSEASEDTPFNIDTAAFEGEIEDVGFRNARLPQPTSSNNLNDAGEYELKEIELGRTRTQDENTSARLDLSRHFTWAERDAKLSFGFKTSQRTKINAETVWVLEDFEDLGFDESELSMTQFATATVDYDLGVFGPGINETALNAVVNDARLELDDFLDNAESSVNDFDIDEDIDAAYLMLRVDSGPWRVLGGVRHERTSFVASGARLEDGVGADDLVAVRVDNDYSHTLPSLHARYELAEDMFLRGAYSSSLVRPNFEQARPGGVLEEDDDEIEAEFGNPLLEATTARNLDIGFEWYLGRAHALSAYLFYKDIEDFIYTTDLAGTPGYTEFGGLPFAEAIVAVNGEDAEVLGLELAYSKQFSSGFLINANVTLSDSEATITAADDGVLISRTIPLPSQSDTTANFAVGYERSNFQIRLAWNYKSSYLLEVSEPLEPSLDLYEDDHQQIDLTGRYFINRNLQLQFQALNLTDEPYYAYVRSSGFNAQHEEYGPTYKLGLVFTNF